MRDMAYIDNAIHPNRGKGVVDMVYTVVVHSARCISIVDLVIRKVNGVREHHIGNAGRHARLLGGRRRAHYSLPLAGFRSGAAVMSSSLEG